MADPIALGFYVLLLLPGFIFIQVYEHHLVRDKVPQFEKTFVIIVASAAIWTLAWALPWLPPCTTARDEVLRALLAASKPDQLTAAVYLPFAKMLMGVCFWTFVTANIWGSLRKSNLVDLLCTAVTGRDWYSSVSSRFLEQYCDNPVILTLENKKYLGRIESAPQSEDDKYISLTDVSVIPLVAEPGKTLMPEPLKATESLLIRFDDIKQIEALKMGADLKQPEPVSLWQLIREELVSLKQAPLPRTLIRVLLWVREQALRKLDA